MSSSADITGGYSLHPPTHKPLRKYDLFKWKLTVAYLGFDKGGHGERAEREPITGGQGAKPPWSWNTFCFWVFNGSRKFAHFFWNLETQKITASYQMQSHVAILIAYCIGMKKDHQTLFNFAILAGKRQKHLFMQKRTFLYKVALKNFHNRTKGGGIAPWSSP